MKKKIIIIGTGFSSLMAVIVAVSKGYKPLILDHDQRTNLNTNHLRNSYLTKSSNFGGLSNFWGGAISKIDTNLNKYCLNSKKLNKFYKIIDNLFNQLGKNDQYSKYFSLKKNIIKNNQVTLKVADHRSLIFGSSRIALSNNKIFSTKNILLSLLKKRKIKIKRKFEVIKLIEKENKIFIYSSNNKVETCHKVFLGAGAYNSAKIIMNSNLNINKVLLKENTISYGIVIFKKKIHFKENNPYCDYFLTKIGKNNYHNQIYFLKDEFLNKIKKNSYFYYIILKILKKIFKNRLVIILNYMNMNISNKILINKNGNFGNLEKKLYKKDYYTKIKNDISKVFKNYKPYFIFFKEGNFGESNHYGSSFPITKNNKFRYESDMLGRIKYCKNIHIIDSSSLPILPTNTITYTLMAHSARITENSLNLFKKKN